uniref:Ankyrin repeat domain 2 n=1 Tax=Rhinopithecus bieti TaxID=61621 RepID=A0A2K6M517_RHIBE
MAKAPSWAGVGALAYKAPEALWPAEAVVDGTMEDSEAVQKATALIEQRLAQEEENEFRRTALHRSSLEGHVEILEKLLTSGATVDFQDRLDCTAMHWACRGGHLEVVKLLQSRGADTNVRDKEGDTALHDAVRLNRYKIIKLLLLHGADMMTKNLAGKTPTDLVQLWQTDTRHALEHPEPGAEHNGLEGPDESGRETPQPVPAQ